MIVVDASLVVDALVSPQRSGDAAAALLAAEEAHAPHLIDVEVASALRRWNARGRIDDTEASQAVDDLLALPLVRYPHVPLLPTAWGLRRFTSLQDGVYVALAKLLGVPLVTTDQRLARGADRGVEIRVVGR